MQVDVYFALYNAGYELQENMILWEGLQASKRMLVIVGCLSDSVTFSLGNAAFKFPPLSYQKPGSPILELYELLMVHESLIRKAGKSWNQEEPTHRKFGVTY